MCLCLTGCCRCRDSLAKPVQIISVIDMVSSVLFVTYETANFGLLTGLIDRSENNCTNCTTSTLRDYVPEGFLSKFDFETVTVMSLVVLIFIGFIIEGSLYSKLKSGKRLKIHLFCKKWLEFRMVLLLATILMAVTKYIRQFYAVSLYFDGVVDGVTKTYRVISMCIVKGYLTELEDTVGIVYVKPPKRPKRGSLSLR